MMKAKQLLKGLTNIEIESESANIYDVCVNCLEKGEFGGAQEYAQRMAERNVLRGMSAENFLGGMLTLRDVYGRSLFEKYRNDLPRLFCALDIYEPVANGILSIVAMSFVAERERLVHQQQEAIRELSTPVLQVREGLLILPIIGLLDSYRARQLTEQLLRSIREKRARVVVLDLTGVATVDSKVANHLLQTISACRLMGARAIITGLSPEIAQTLVTIGVELGSVVTMSDLQSGIEEADRMLGYHTLRNSAAAYSAEKNR
jgi:rsbT co-antagonist protein RsbR